MSDLVVGVDIGGTTVKIGVVDLKSGNIIRQESIDTPQNGAQNFAEVVVNSVKVLLNDYPAISSLGAGVPGSMNLDRTMVLYPPNLIGWKEEPLKKYFTDLLPQFQKIEIDNDANVAALAEAHFGAGKDQKFFLLATLGTGVGGGLIFTNANEEQTIFRGAFGSAGEFGHTSIDYNGPQCRCGAKGCIETYLGHNYLTARTIEKLKNGTESILSEYLTKEGLTPLIISEAAIAGDDFAKSVYDEAGMLLGVAFANVAKLLDIRTFLVGGGVAQAGDMLLEPARKSLQASVLANQKENVLILPAALGNNAGIVGAAMLGGM